MRASRALQRSKIKRDRKEAKSQLNRIARIIDNATKSCSKCSEPFDNKNQEHLDNWRVLVYDDRAELYCDRCYNPSENQENTDGQGTPTETV